MLSPLVDRAQQGDEDAFVALTQAVGDRCMAIAYRILRDAALAEDAVQTALTTAWRELPTLRDRDRGDRVLFFRTADETDSDGVAMNLFVVNTDGTGLLQLNPPETTTALRGPSGVSSWSSDGTQVVFVASEGDWATEPRAVFIAGTDGEPAQRITDWGDILTAQWSPDGQRIAMTMLDGGEHQIFTVRPDGSDLTPITSTDDGTFCFGAMWSPDSSQLLYLRGTELRSSMDLWVSNADGTNPIQVTHSSSEIGGYEWVP